MYLTTEGWKTRTPHRIEIWYVQHQGRYFLVSQYGEEAHWVRNIKSNPQVKFEVGSEKFAGLGRVIDHDTEPELASVVARQMDAKYKWSNGLIIELRPEPGGL